MLPVVYCTKFGNRISCTAKAGEENAKSQRDIIEDKVNGMFGRLFEVKQKLLAVLTAPVRPAVRCVRIGSRQPSQCRSELRDGVDYQ